MKFFDNIFCSSNPSPMYYDFPQNRTNHQITLENLKRGIALKCSYCEEKFKYKEKDVIKEERYRRGESILGSDDGDYYKIILTKVIDITALCKNCNNSLEIGYLSTDRTTEAYDRYGGYD